MKSRLGIFFAALLLLPIAGLWLSGHEWSDLGFAQHSNLNATLASVLLMLAYIALMNMLVTRRTKNNLLNKQRNFFWAVAAASVLLCAVLNYLDCFVGLWAPAALDSPLSMMLDAVLWAALAPAVLVTRAWLGSFPSLLTSFGRMWRLPNPSREVLVCVLPPLALLGLFGGAAWPEQLFWLFWAAPLLILCSLQVLWGESTLFSGLKYGDWGRVFCAGLAGLIVGNLTMFAYLAAGGELGGVFPHHEFTQVAFVLFGFLSVQLADVLAEQWRGKQGVLPRGKKAFPIPVVTQIQPAGPSKKCGSKCS